MSNQIDDINQLPTERVVVVRRVSVTGCIVMVFSPVQRLV
jgi:hypothetical protein